LKSIIITQSNYIPWKGYIDSIASVDNFVVYDDMQYTKRDWRNRNLIKTPQGLKWISIPVIVKGKYFQKINEVKVLDQSWKSSHLGVIKAHYAQAKCFKTHFPMVEDWFQHCNYEYLTDINLHFLNLILRFFEIRTPLILSSDFELGEDRTQRLIDICLRLGATDYWSGPAAKAYMDESKFEMSGVKVNYWDYFGYPEHTQLYQPFEHGVSILDLILNEGDNASKYLKWKP
jgi:hypothetical protein